MNRMLFTVALHEFRASVMRASFVWMTLGMPVLILLYGATVFWIGANSASEVQRQVAPSRGTAVVDPANLLGETEEFTRYESVQGATIALDRGRISAFVVLPDDYLQRGELELYTDHYDWRSALVPRRLVEPLHDRLLRAAGVDEALIERIQSGTQFVQHERDGRGGFVEIDPALELAAFGIPVGTTFALIIALAMNASLLLASVVEDKENKMMDVLLSSTRADDLLFGKVLGIVGAGLLQLTVWFAMTLPFGLLSLYTFVDDVGALWAAVSLPRLLLAVALGVLSFVFYGVMLVGLGSFGSSFRDSQQLAAVVIMLPMVPVMTSPIFLTGPNSTTPRLLSFFPPTSAPAMMLRVAVAEIAWWEIALSFGVLVVSILLAVRGAAKLFRAGTLLYGKRPSLRLLWRALVEPM